MCTDVLPGHPSLVLILQVQMKSKQRDLENMLRIRDEQLQNLVEQYTFRGGVIGGLPGFASGTRIAGSIRGGGEQKAAGSGWK